MKLFRDAVLTACLFALFAGGTSAQEWTRFRGPNGSGLSDARTVPVRFTEKDYNWQIDLPGSGHSTPIVWGDYVFVTAAIPYGQKKPPPEHDAEGAHVSPDAGN